MADLLYPLNNIQPSEIMSQYNEWIYFALMLVFFIAVAGISLRRHFDRPYVKPLIIAVGLMMTVGIFKFRYMLPRIFEGFGIVGSILLVFVAAVIPFGLSRGFGMGGSKAFFLTYILIYIIGWIQFPDVFYALGNKNLGLVNLVLFIVFVVAIFKVALPIKGLSLKGSGSSKPTAHVPEIDREMHFESEEDQLMESRAEKLTRMEIRTLADIEHSLKKIKRMIDKRRNDIAREERENIASIIQDILRKEALFRQSISGLQKLFKKLGAMDHQQLKEKKERLQKVTGKEHAVLKVEVSAEEEKVKIEKEIVAFEQIMDQSLLAFHKRLGEAVKLIRSSFPYDSIPYLAQAEETLMTILKILRDVKHLEERLEKMIKIEKKLLKTEKQEA